MYSMYACKQNKFPEMDNKIELNWIELNFELASRDTKTITSLEKEIEQLKEQQDEAEQYSRRNCLIFHGLKEREGENTNEMVQHVCEEKLNIKLQNGDIDRTHHLGAKKDKSRGIIIRFTSYDVRNRVYLPHTFHIP